MGKKTFLSLIACGLLVMCGCTSTATSDGGTSEEVDQMYEGYRKDLGELPEISAEEMLALEIPPIIVDVREDKERAVSVIPGAISQKEYEEREDWPAEQTVVVYCTIGLRSGHYVKKLADRGVHAKNLKGSILSWTHAGGDVVDPQGNSTRRVHVYGKKWNLLPEGYEPVW